VPDGPNILFFFADQFLHSAMGCAGHAVVKTPHLDRLAERGVRFPNAFCASPVCVPARISLFTGQYPHTHGQPDNSYAIRPGTKIFIETLQQAGYHTGAVGKLHFKPHAETSRFDFVRLHDGLGNSDYMRWLASIDPDLAEDRRHAYPVEGEAGFVYGRDPRGDGEKVPTIMYGTSQIDAEHFYTQWVSDTAIAYLERHGGDPFFLFVSFVGPHSPFFLPEPYRSMYDPRNVEVPGNWREDLSDKPRSHGWRHSLYGTKYMTEQQLREITALYYGHITLIDEHVGRVLDRLEAMGLVDNTIVAFSADHGEMLGAHGMFYKGVMYDESLQIPLLIRDPRCVGGTVADGLVSQVDIMPTLLDTAGVAVPAWSQGRSMKAMAQGDPSAGRDAVFAEIENCAGEYVLACRTRDYLFSYLQQPDGNPGTEGELYDLRRDPCQERNLFGDRAHTAAVDAFKNRLLYWLANVRTEEDRSC